MTAKATQFTIRAAAIAAREALGERAPGRRSAGAHDPSIEPAHRPLRVPDAEPAERLGLPGRGAVVHERELGQLARSAGTSAVLMAREGTYAQVRLRSGEVRKIHIECRATLGEVSNEEHSLRQYGKAGAIRWKGIRPTVRGTAMNPVDHPHGGGEGRTGEGQAPVSPWNTLTKGFRTRNNKRTQTFIVSRRKK